ncbi:MAG: ABC transporter substrate-binding protein [Candidatus Tectimicrobiota bacterium]|nr:MAG: ABC transporter substrate-binding protein [Candidatus Tectomicrobia bacterium]
MSQQVHTSSREAPGLCRRTFLQMAGAMALGAGATLALPRRAPAALRGTKLHHLQWSSFVAPADDEMRRMARDFQKATGVEVTIETINMNDLQARISTAIESGTGPDVVQMFWNWPQLYGPNLVDVDDLAEEISRRDGAYYAQLVDSCKVGGRWKAVPFCFVGNAIVYREDLFQQAGITRFPDTWDAYLEAGRKLKAMGYPIGQAFGHSLGDPPSFAYPLLWSYGGKEVDASGKVVLNSKETLEAVKFCMAFYKEALDEGGLAWDDTSNNRAYFAETISATLNGVSIYFVAKQKFPHLAKVSNHAPNPAGPAGRYHMHLTQEHAIMKYSPNVEAAKEWIRFVMQRDNFTRWMEVQEGYSLGPTPYWENIEMWEKDPKLDPYRRLAQYSRVFGYEGPPNAKAQEVFAKYIIVDMFARAIQSGDAQGAIAWAESELKKVYEA